MLLLVAACAPPAGQLRQVGEGGIGGTGIEGGIGGTGVVGALTDFGSIEVNGLSIAVPDDAQIRSDGQRIEPQDLRLGEIVEVFATPEPAGLTARTVTVRYQVSGPVERVDGNRLQALGQTVVVDGATVVAPAGERPALGRLDSVAPGDWIEVSGLRTSETRIAASRVAVVPAETEQTLTGALTLGPDGRFSVAGQPVAFAGPSPAPGSVVTVRGRAVDDSLLVTETEVVPAVPFARDADRLSLQGFYPAGTAVVGPDQIAGTDAGIAGSRIVDGSLQPDGRVRVERSARYEGPDDEDDDDDDWDRPSDDWSPDSLPSEDGEDGVPTGSGDAIREDGDLDDDLDEDDAAGDDDDDDDGDDSGDDDDDDDGASDDDDGDDDSDDDSGDDDSGDDDSGDDDSGDDGDDDSDDDNGDDDDGDDSD